MRISTLLLIPLLLTICLTYPAKSPAREISSFEEAKKELRILYRNHPSWRRTIYCNAEFTAGWKIKQPQGFTYPSQYTERASRVEWEHVVPAENFGRHFTEWREGVPACNGKKGRVCARKNALFSRMEADMHNLFPSIGAVNAARSNYRYAILNSGEKPFGSCEAIIDGRRFSPPEISRGTVARASLYMAYKYQKDLGHLFSRQQMSLFHAWHKMYPPDAIECERNDEIAKIQGDRNIFIQCE